MVQTSGLKMLAVLAFSLAEAGGSEVEPIAFGCVELAKSVIGLANNLMKHKKGKWCCAD